MAITVHSSVFTTGYSFMSGRGGRRRQAAQALRGLPELRELMYTLNGAAAGSAASVVQKRITAVEGQQQGGIRPVEDNTRLSRNTTAGDITAINDDILTLSQYDSTPAVNLNRNPLAQPGNF